MRYFHKPKILDFHIITFATCWHTQKKLSPVRSSSEGELSLGVLSTHWSPHFILARLAQNSFSPSDFPWLISFWMEIDCFVLSHKKEFPYLWEMLLHSDVVTIVKKEKRWLKNHYFELYQEKYFFNYFL